MSGTFPSSPAFQQVDFRSILPTSVSTSISGRRQARQLAGQRWGLTGILPPMTRASFAPIFAFCVKQRGQLDTFTLIPPVLSTRQATTTIGSPLVAGASQTGRTLTTDGWGADGTCMKAGDFFKLTGNDKIYMCTADATASSYSATLTFEPALLTSPDDNTSITVSSVPFTVSLNSEIQEFFVDPNYYDYEIDFIEAL